MKNLWLFISSWAYINIYLCIIFPTLISLIIIMNVTNTSSKMINISESLLDITRYTFFIFIIYYIIIQVSKKRNVNHRKAFIRIPLLVLGIILIHNQLTNEINILNALKETLLYLLSFIYFSIVLIMTNLLLNLSNSKLKNYNIAK